MTQRLRQTEFASKRELESSWSDDKEIAIAINLILNGYDGMNTNAIQYVVSLWLVRRFVVAM